MATGVLFASVLSDRVAAAVLVHVGLADQLPPLAHENQPYAWTFLDDSFSSSKQEPLTYDVAGLPPWAHFDTKTHTISGTPAKKSPDDERSNVTVTAKEAGGDRTASSFQLTTISAPAPTLSHSLQDQLPRAASMGQGNMLPGKVLHLPLGWSFSVGFSGDTFVLPQQDRVYYSTYLEGAKPLPSWLVFNETEMTYSGVAPTDAGPNGTTYTILLFGSNRAHAGGPSTNFSMVVSGGAITFSGPVPLPSVNLTEGQTLQYNVTPTSFLVNGKTPQPQPVSVGVAQGAPPWVRYDERAHNVTGMVPSAGNGTHVVTETIPVNVTHGHAKPAVFNVQLNIYPSPFNGNLQNITVQTGKPFSVALAPYLRDAHVDLNATVSSMAHRRGIRYRHSVPVGALVRRVMPSWIQYDAANKLLTGTAPDAEQQLNVRLDAASPVRGAAQPPSSESFPLFVRNTTHVTPKTMPAHHGLTPGEKGAIGGAIGGFFVLLALCALLLCCVRHRRRRAAAGAAPPPPAEMAADPQHGVDPASVPAADGPPPSASDQPYADDAPHTGVGGLAPATGAAAGGAAVAYAVGTHAPSPGLRPTTETLPPGSPEWRRLDDEVAPTPFLGQTSWAPPMWAAAAAPAAFAAPSGGAGAAAAPRADTPSAQRTARMPLAILPVPSSEDSHMSPQPALSSSGHFTSAPESRVGTELAHDERGQPAAGMGEDTLAAVPRTEAADDADAAPGIPAPAAPTSSVVSILTAAAAGAAGAVGAAIAGVTGGGGTPADGREKQAHVEDEEDAEAASVAEEPRQPAVISNLFGERPNAPSRTSGPSRFSRTSQYARAMRDEHEPGLGMQNVFADTNGYDSENTSSDMPTMLSQRVNEAMAAREKHDDDSAASWEENLWYGQSRDADAMLHDGAGAPHAAPDSPARATTRRTSTLSPEIATALGVSAFGQMGARPRISSANWSYLDEMRTGDVTEGGFTLAPVAVHGEGVRGERADDGDPATGGTSAATVRPFPAPYAAEAGARSPPASGRSLGELAERLPQPPGEERLPMVAPPSGAAGTGAAPEREPMHLVLTPPPVGAPSPMRHRPYGAPTAASPRSTPQPTADTHPPAQAVDGAWRAAPVRQAQVEGVTPTRRRTSESVEPQDVAGMFDDADNDAAVDPFAAYAYPYGTVLEQQREAGIRPLSHMSASTDMDEFRTTEGALAQMHALGGDDVQSRRASALSSGSARTWQLGTPGPAGAAPVSPPLSTSMPLSQNRSVNFTAAKPPRLQLASARPGERVMLPLVGDEVPLPTHVHAPGADAVFHPQLFAPSRNDLHGTWPVWLSWLAWQPGTQELAGTVPQDFALQHRLPMQLPVHILQAPGDAGSEVPPDALLAARVLLTVLPPIPGDL
ncbi:polarity establishment/cellular polarization [Malassezia sp. CBS 17886]|nr:polarity establishment/cellular polarization [Malassezia sp. CBS 17886]